VGYLVVCGCQPMAGHQAVTSLNILRHSVHLSIRRTPHLYKAGQVQVGVIIYYIRYLLKTTVFKYHKKFLFYAFYRFADH